MLLVGAIAFFSALAVVSSSPQRVSDIETTQLLAQGWVFFVQPMMLIVAAGYRFREYTKLDIYPTVRRLVADIALCVFTFNSFASHANPSVSVSLACLSVGLAISTMLNRRLE